MLSQPGYTHEDQMGSFLKLAQTKWRPIIEAGDKKGDTLLERSPEKAALCAQLLENEARGLMSLSEDLRTANIGTFDKFAFPLIRTIYPNLVATEIVSVQPMQGPNSLVFFVDAKYDNSKSPVAAGQEAISPLTGHEPSSDFTSELVADALIGTGNGGTAAYGPVTFGAWLPIRRNSVVITTDTATVGAVTATDDGNGGLVGTGVTSGSINYSTGAVSITFANNVTNNEKILMSYRYVMEGNTSRPKFGLNITSSLVVAETRSLETDWSVEAETDLKALHGLAAQELLMGLVAEQLRYEIDRQIIADLLVLANANTSMALTWDYTSPTSVDYYLHQLSFLSVLANARNQIFSATRGLGEANFCVCGTNFATVVEAIPQFQRVAYGQATGVVYIGTLAGIRFYKDPWLDKDTGIVGYKGNDWLRSGYVYAPYVPLWRTPVITLTDMNRRVALMTRYGTKIINRNFYLKITIQHFGIPN